MLTHVLDVVAGYFRYDLFGLVYVAAGFFNMSLGFVVLFRDRNDPVNRSFFYVSTVAFIWSVSIGMISLTARTEDSWFWLSMQYFFGVPFISPTVYLFSSRWVKKDNKVAITIGFIFAVIAMFFYSFFPHSAWTIKERWWGRYPNYILDTPRVIFVTFLLTYFFIYAFMAFANFYRGWQQSDNPRERAQFRNILIGFLIAYTGAFDFVAAFDIDVPTIGFLSLSILMGIIAYTILKHEFLNINLVLKKGLLIILIYSALLAFSLPIAITMVNYNQNVPVRPMSTILYFGCFLGIVLSFGPVIYAYLARRNFWLRETMSTGLAHELKSPIGAIQGALELAMFQMKAPEGDKERAIEYLELIQKNTDRLGNYVKDLLNLAQIQKGDVRLDKSMLDFTEIIQRTVEQSKPIAAHKGIALTFNPIQLPLVLIDGRKMEQVISNLISNALRYSDQGHVRISIEHQPPVVRCTVADEGRGISRQNLDRVFDRFFQEKNSSKGSGIGLTIAKAWVESHGGKIWAESNGEGKGTKVTFTVPV
jgi:signal transduction histidine kinase